MSGMRGNDSVLTIAIAWNLAVCNQIKIASWLLFVASHYITHENNVNES